jgi:hypothetical protein
VSDEEISSGSVDGTRPPSIVRSACFLLVLAGVFSVVLAGPAVLNPGDTRCRLARSWVEDANEDKKEWNNVDTGGVEPDDLACLEAVRLAETIPLKEKEPEKKVSVPDEGQVRLQAGLAVVMALGSAVAGVFLYKTLNRRARNVAVAMSAFGIVTQPLGFISLGVFLFVVYALAFSGPSRMLWPKVARQPRGPAAGESTDE